MTPTPEATQAAIDAVAKAPCLRFPEDFKCGDGGNLADRDHRQHPECAVAALQADRSLLLGLLGIEDDLKTFLGMVMKLRNLNHKPITAEDLEAYRRVSALAGDPS